MWQYFFKSLHIIGWFLLTCIAALLFILYTQSGLYCTLYFAKKFAPATLSYETVEGSLLGGFVLQRVRYQQDDINIRVARLSLEWQPSTLLHRQVTVKSLTLHHLKAMGLRIRDIQLSGQVSLVDELPLSLNVNWEIDQPLYSEPLPFCLNEQGSIKTAYSATLRPFLEEKARKESYSHEMVYRQYMTKINDRYQATEDAPTNHIKGRINIAGDEKNYDIQALIIKPFDLDLEANVQNIFEDNPQFRILLSWEKILLNNQLSMNTSGDLDLSGDLKHYQGNLDASMQLEGVTYPLQATIKATPTMVDGAILAGDKSHWLSKITLQGQHTPKVDLNWAISVPDVAKLPLVKKESVEASGAIDAQGTIKGTSTDLDFRSLIQASEFKYQQLYIKKILSHINVFHLFTKKTSADLDIQLKPGDLIYINEKEKNVIPFKKFNAQLQWKNHLLKTNIEWIFDAAKRFEGECIIQPVILETFDPEHLERQKLSGHLLFVVNNLDFVNTPTSPLTKVKGAIQAKINLGGTLAKPSWDGLATIKAQGFLSDLGLMLNQINVDLKTTPKEMRLNGKIVSGKNVLSIVGESTAINAEKSGFEAFKAKVTGNNFPVMNTNEYQVYATPDLDIQWAQKKGEEGKLVVRGNIDVPSARIQPLEFNQAVELPSDVVFVSDQQKEEDTTPLFELDSQINVRLGNDVQINTHGIKGKLAGSVMVIDKSNAPTAGEGEIHMINGTYNAYGQVLTIDKGEADFTGGAIDNPQLMIRAVRTFNMTNNNFSPISNNVIPDTSSASNTDAETSLNDFNQITVGIEITGTADNPVVRLFSNPATLSQADILSFLVLGRPMAQASSADGALLMRALSALNVGGGQETQIVQQLQQTFGLDVLSVETSSQYDSAQNSMTNNTSLVIGKKLSSRLFIDYSIGIMQNTNILKIKYLLTPHWMLQTATDGTNEGVDIIYSITKN